MTDFEKGFMEAVKFIFNNCLEPNTSLTLADDAKRVLYLYKEAQ